MIYNLLVWFQQISREAMVFFFFPPSEENLVGSPPLLSRNIWMEAVQSPATIEAGNPVRLDWI
jgi:hypothetical protein